jgi:CubicO group peptidase (beta-lactamase class C family)
MRNWLREFQWDVILLCVLLVLLTGTGCTQKRVTSQDSLNTFSIYLDERIPALMKKYAIPGVSMALIQDGELVWSGAYGYADLEQAREMTVDAVCRAESVSKSVTAWGVMRLVEQGLVDLDAPVQAYIHDWQLPATEYDEDAVTIRRLLSNNAGMPPGTIGHEYPPQSEILGLREDLTQEAQLIREPGTGFLYSNPGFNLLELLIEEVTGRDFATYMAAEVLIPLGMPDSSYDWRDSYQDSLPTGYELQGDPVPPYVYPAKASGGLFANVEDLARFVSAEMTGYYTDQSVLNQDSIQMLHTPQVEIPGLFGFVADSYGFGHFIETLPDGRKAVWHGGQGHGWMTHFHGVPESGDGIVILTNSQRSWPFLAKVLTDWAQWSGLESVKFGIITKVTTALKTLIVLIGLGSLWQVIRLVQGLRRGKRTFAPLSPISLPRRMLQALIGLGIIVTLAWSAAQPYLFLSSIFPSTIRWAGSSLLILAILIILSSCFPSIESTNKGAQSVS